MLRIPELQPLLDKVAVLKENPDASDVYEYVVREVNAAYTPSMGQTACIHIIALCHPRAWGDRRVQGLDSSRFGWIDFLSELEHIANACGQQIFENSGGKG